MRHSSQVVVDWKESEGMHGLRVAVCLYLKYELPRVSIRGIVCSSRYVSRTWLRVSDRAAPARASTARPRTQICRRHGSLVNHHDYAIFAWRNPHGKAALCPGDRIDYLRSRPIAKFEIFFLTLRNATFLKFILTLHHMGIWVEDRYERFLVLEQVVGL